jgi:uncharacterized repeat protein (TIGR03803 family)
MKTHLVTFHNGLKTFPKTKPVTGPKPILALLVRMVLAAEIVFPCFSMQAGVVFMSLYSFQNGSDGSVHNAALVQGSDGYFYGTTSDAGTPYGYGTVFKITTNGMLTNLYSFSGGNDGAEPNGLVQGSDGYFYGTTEYNDYDAQNGSYSGAGTAFKISTNGVLTNLYSFTGGDDGANPGAGLVLGGDGNFYGTTRSGGTNNWGTVFKISTNGALTNMFSFNGTNGASPNGLVQGSDGNFYGTTEVGGNAMGLAVDLEPGTVFKITTNGTLTSYTLSDGAGPTTGLVQGRDGNLYGTTYNGGAGGYGTVFKISTNGVQTNLYSFSSSSGSIIPGPGGAWPAAGLIQASDGYLYGTSTAGGTTGDGTVFQISTNGALSILYTFGTLTNNGGFPLDGASPAAALVQGADGSFYGTAQRGGAYGYGTVFRFSIVPEFRAVTLLSDSRLNLSWSTESGGSYQLQYNSDLALSNWLNLGSPVTAAGATLNTTDFLTNGPQRFYRVVLLP